MRWKKESDSMELGSRWFPKKVQPSVHKRVAPKSVYDLKSLKSKIPLKALFRKPSKFSMFVKNFLWTFPRNNDVIWTSNPHSGFNWLFSIIIDIMLNEYGIKYKHKFKDGLPYYPREFYGQLNLQPRMGDLEIPFRFDLPIPRLLHTHKFPKSFLNCSLLLQIRNPVDSIVSRYYTQLPAISSGKTYYPNISMTEFIEEGAHKPYINFFNIWGEFLEKYNPNILIIKYEELKEDTEKCVSKAIEFVGLSSVKAKNYMPIAIKEHSLENIRSDLVK